MCWKRLAVLLLPYNHAQNVTYISKFRATTKNITNVEQRRIGSYNNNKTKTKYGFIFNIRIGWILAAYNQIKHRSKINWHRFGKLDVKTRLLDLLNSLLSFHSVSIFLSSSFPAAHTPFLYLYLQKIYYFVFLPHIGLILLSHMLKSCLKASTTTSISTNKISTLHVHWVANIGPAPLNSNIISVENIVDAAFTMRIRVRWVSVLVRFIIRLTCMLKHIVSWHGGGLHSLQSIFSQK